LLIYEGRRIEKGLGGGVKEEKRERKKKKMGRNQDLKEFKYFFFKLEEKVLNCIF
jgi:hypothetical protein